ncbi:hypothetical protein MTR67_003081 [Solanum verrucosum]|uniref:Uncharacterized protein n=1 Tax=Solanum verrucosum TaxID=315347 RepID=A0AAF0T912_SOLVR|nr:hypothetical protein MTR67_003081 [Solanum verrucosum]
MGKVQPVREVDRQDDRAQCYAFPGKNEAEVSDAVITERGGVLASIEVRATFIEEIKAKQFEDENLNELKKKTVSGKTQETTLDAEGVLTFKGRICVPRVDDLIQKLLAESHGFRYSINLGVTKM